MGGVPASETGRATSFNAVLRSLGFSTAARERALAAHVGAGGQVLPTADRYSPAALVDVGVLRLALSGTIAMARDTGAGRLGPKSPTRRLRSTPATGRSWPRCWPPSATTATSAAADAGSPRRAFPDPSGWRTSTSTRNTNIAPTLIGQLAAGGWVAAGQPLCLIGDSGTGKTHLLIALGTAVAEAGHRVRYVTTAGLVNELVEAADERVLSKTIARYGRVDLLCCDELGYLELDRRGAELLFQVFTEREERASVAIAANAPFSKAHRFRARYAHRHLTFIGAG